MYSKQAGNRNFISLLTSGRNIRRSYLLSENRNILVQDAVLQEQKLLTPTGHTPVDDAEVPATCTEAGETSGTHCSVCNAILSGHEVIPATGHTAVVDAAVAATCTETGLTEVVAKDDGNTVVFFLCEF